MTHEDIKGLLAHVRVGEELRAKDPERMYVIDGDAYSYLSKGVTRLLEERTRLLDELLRQACQHNKGCGNPNCAKIAAAIAFAEEAATP